MINAPRLLKDLQRLLKELEDDLRERSSEQLEVDSMLRTQYREARDAGRTGQAFEVWRDEFLTQVAVAWILGCVFVRFMEDNGLVETPRLSAPGNRRQRALDQHELYFKDPERRTHSDREYLLDVFEQTQNLPAARELFDAKHNPLWAVGLSGDGATKLLQFWQRLDPETGALDHDFTDSDWNTRFLGDLYQDLSESARKKYALLQTPEFVEEFILDRTLTPAIKEFGFQEVRLIDPTCGSGHFLLGAFHRLFDLWVKHEPGANPRELVQRALNQVYGVDLNPFAVAIARFRLLVEGLRASGVERISDAPEFHLNLAAGDSLLHGSLFRATAGVQQSLDPEEDPIRHVYQTEDSEALRRVLGQQYHAVVGNPPYITVKDKALSDAYRARFAACHRQYSLAVPFIERFFDLAHQGSDAASAGFVGLIVANSFMKREFGKKVIEEVLPRLDLTHIVDTSGAYIPGHGTPTAILFGRHRPPLGGYVRAVQGIRGEQGTPVTPAKGRVWVSILEQIDQPGSEGDWVSATDVPRSSYTRHPWSLGGGGAAELQAELEENSEVRLGHLVAAIGRTTVVGEDDAWIMDWPTARRMGVDRRAVGFGIGECFRDWCESDLPCVLYPYESIGGEAIDSDEFLVQRHLWRYRTVLRSRTVFGKSLHDMDRPWYEHLENYRDKLKTPLSIAFAFVASHNHFVLDNGGKVFKQSAPIIKLPVGASRSDHLSLLGVLNSSTACFWMKQVFQPKSHSTQRHHPDPARGVYEFAATPLREFPLPASWSRDRTADLASVLDQLARERAAQLSADFIERCQRSEAARLREQLSGRWQTSDVIRERMIALQEELDWQIYEAYGLVTNDLLLGDEEPLDDMTGPRGSRPFEKLGGRRSLVRRAGEVVPIGESEVPAQGKLSPRLVELWKRREEEIKKNRQLGLVERLEFKRVWRDTDDNISEPEYRRRRDAEHLRLWLLNAIEVRGAWSDPTLTSCNRLADRLGADPEFVAVAQCYRDRPDFDMAALVQELVGEETVPALAVNRYKPAGIRKHEIWSRVWDLQRIEDEIDTRAALPSGDPDYLSPDDATGEKAESLGTIPVPPRFSSADFQNTAVWRLRGKLDVPKERFIGHLNCEVDSDPSLVVGWAGWSSLQHAGAIAAYYLKMREQEGWSSERLTPLLAALLEVVPWVKQWHNELDPQSQVRMGDYFEAFVNEEARALGLTLEQIRSWRPSKKTRVTKREKRGARKKAKGEAKPA